MPRVRMGVVLGRLRSFLCRRRHRLHPALALALTPALAPRPPAQRRQACASAPIPRCLLPPSRQSSELCLFSRFLRFSRLGWCGGRPWCLVRTTVHVPPIALDLGEFGGGMGTRGHGEGGDREGREDG